MSADSGTTEHQQLQPTGICLTVVVTVRIAALCKHTVHMQITLSLQCECCRKQLSQSLWEPSFCTPGGFLLCLVLAQLAPQRPAGEKEEEEEKEEEKEDRSFDGYWSPSGP